MENGTVKGDSKQSETTKKRSKPNIISRMFLCWVCPVLIKGNKRDVEEADLIIPPNKQNDSHIAGEKLERNWLIEYENATNKGKNPSLSKAIAKTYWLSFMPGSIYVLINAVVRTIQPMVFSQLLNYWTVDSQMTQLEAAYYALGMVAINLTTTMTQHHNTLFTQRFAMKIKVACSAILYRKLLRVNQASVGDIAAGKLVNLLSNDVARFDYAFMFMHNIWIIPIQVAVILYFMWQSAGYAGYVGLFSVVLIITPIQIVLTKLTAIIRRKTAARTDKRIKLMDEIISGIQVIKMYAWEKPFQIVIAAARAYEVSMLKKSTFVKSTFLGFMMFTERTILLVTCLTLILSGNMVTATLIYPLQQYFSIFQMQVVMILPIAITSISEMLVAIERIQSFLEIDEREDIKMMTTNKLASNLTFSAKQTGLQISNQVTAQKYSVNSDELRKNSLATSTIKDRVGAYAIELNGVSASWTQDPSEMTIKKVSVRLRKGKSCAIIGPVGAGKSSLLQVVLKELQVLEGTLNVHGTVSYASQESWLYPATVRENILFGLPYDSKKYKEVTRACCLLPDFKQFPYGDLSLVGERGVSLSGGQRARINLARAVYREADIYLLDDPLSAVDANVGRSLFEGCINGYLRGRTVVLVTHQVHFVQACDIIIVLNEGSIENMGTYEELNKTGKDYMLMLTRKEEEEEAEEKVDKRSSLKRSVSLQRGISVKSEEGQEDQEEQIEIGEERQTGSLKWAVIAEYLRSVNSPFILFCVLLALILTQGAATFTDYWLSFWTNQINEYISENGVEPDADDLNLQVGALTTAQYLGIYGGLVGAVIVFLFGRITIFVTATIRASKNLHNTVFYKLIGSVMRFFDTSSSGRILNRFSKDLGAVDEMLPRSSMETIQMYLSMTSVLILNAMAMPYTLIPTAVLVVVFVFLLKWYLNAAQAVKRLEGTTKSPVFGKISSTIAGLSTIRASDAQQSLLRDFDNAQDLHSRAFYTYIGGSSAFAMYLDSLCIVYLATILAIFILLDFGEMIPVGSIGLAVSQSVQLTMLLQMAARYTADFLAQATAVERVLEYSKLPTEENIEEGPTKPSNDWPGKGAITFDKVYMRYGPDDPHVLKNLNIVIQSGWKVGVVGRTGAGKSSLITALFRLYDIEGVINIDGIDTVGVAKKELRSKLSIIPQEPVLFSASLRYNLDPFDSYSDDEIWRALEQVELKDAIPALDFKVSEGGSNFSVGQRQLVCLARAILRSNKILIMDEATANVDPQTDGLIQKTIRQAFASCTVLTIAHRLNTIMDSDRVLVMDKGAAVEFDTPYALLSNPNSVFSFMVNETGSSMSRTLFQVAKEKYFSDNPPDDEAQKKDN